MATPRLIEVFLPRIVGGSNATKAKVTKVVDDWLTKRRSGDVDPQSFQKLVAAVSDHVDRKEGDPEELHNVVQQWALENDEFAGQTEIDDLVKMLGEA